MLKILFTIFLAVFCLQGCGNADSDKFNTSYDSSHSSGKYLYVVSGGCYGGGVTTSTAASTVSRFNKKTGAFDKLLIDYNSMSAGDNPVSVVDKDANTLFVATENTGGRRIDIIKKDGSSWGTYLSNTTALSGVIRNLRLLSDGSLLVSKSTAVEKFNAAKARILVGANPYINAPASSCATSTTLISSLATLPNGKIIFAHAAATPNNKIGVISASGYSTTADCLSTQAAPATTALPTAILMHSSGKLLVAYGSTTAGSNYIYSYSINATTNAITGATAAYSDITNVNGPSAMTEDPETGDVFVANALNTFNTIERFSFDPTTGLLTKIGSAPFISPQVYTRCVSSMVVGD